MKNRRLWFALFAVLIISALVLSGCGGDKEEPTPEPAPTEAPAEQAAEPTKAPEEPAKVEPTAVPESTDPWADVDPSGQTVVFWHQHTRDRETALNEIVADFNASNEYGITVVPEYQGGYGDIFNKMLGVMNTSDAPDLVVAYQNQAATYQLADALLDMTSLVESPKWGMDDATQADFFPGFWAQDVFPTFGNARLGIPPNRSMEVLYYNVDWLNELGYDAPPATPEEFKEMACKAVEQPFSKATGEGSMGYQLSLDASRFASFAFAFGGNVFDYDTGEYSYDNAGAEEAMAFLQDLFDEGCATLVAEAYGDQSDFGAGKLLFTVGSSSGLPFYQTATDEGAGHAWSVAPIPHTTAEPVMNIYGASISMPNTTPERELAMWEFVKYYTNPDVQAKWAQVSQYFPVRASVAEGMTDYFAANPAYQIAWDMLPYGTFEPPVPGYDFVRDMVEETMAAMMDGADVQSSLAELTGDANESLAEQMEMVPVAPPPTPTPEPEPEVMDDWKDVDPSGQTVTFWHQHTRDRETALNEIVADFNASNEYGITVVPEYQGGYGDIFTKMLGVMNTSDAPDLVVAYQNQAATYQLGDALLDMNSLVNSPAWGLSEEEQADFFPGFWAQDVFPTFDNARLGIPPNRSMEVLYYNVDWLTELGYDAPPATPEEFKEMACAATAQPFSGATGEGNIGYQLSLDASRFASFAFAFGGDVYDYDANQYSYNNAGAAEAMAFLQDLFAEGCATLVAEAYGDQSDFGAGKLLFTVGSSSGLPFYQTAVDEGAGHAWGVAAIPHTTADPVMNIYGASVSMPNTTPERELAMWEFVKYYTSPDVQAKWAQVSQYFPVRASVAEGMTDYFAANPAYQTSWDMLEYGYFEPPVPGYDFVRDMVEEAMAAIVDGADVQSMLDELTADANDNLAEQLEQIQ